MKSIEAVCILQYANQKMPSHVALTRLNDREYLMPCNLAIPQPHFPLICTFQLSNCSLVTCHSGTFPPSSPLTGGRLQHVSQFGLGRAVDCVSCTATTTGRAECGPRQCQRERHQAQSRGPRRPAASSPKSICVHRMVCSDMCPL